MPSLSLDAFNNFLPKNKVLTDFPVFVETGTCRGTTAALASNHFQQVITIEIEPTLYKNAKARFVNIPNVTCLYGDSSAILPEIVPRIDTPVMFFLDAHYSGGDTGHGIQKVPLLSELKTITSACRPACIVVVDDARLFGLKNDGAGCDWTSITAQSVLSIVKPRVVHYFTLPSKLADVDQLVFHMAPLKPVAATATGSA